MYIKSIKNAVEKRRNEVDQIKNRKSTNNPKDEDYTTDYEKRLAKYHEELDEYHRDCEKIAKMYEQLLNDEITQEYAAPGQRAV